MHFSKKKRRYQLEIALYKQGYYSQPFAYGLRYRYNITIEDYYALLIRQDYVCCVCHKDETMETRKGVRYRLSVEHNHESGRIRGLVCGSCNRKINISEVRGDYLLFPELADFDWYGNIEKKSL